MADTVLVKIAKYLRHTRQDGTIVEYPPGEHEMSPEDADHWFVKAHTADAQPSTPSAGTEQMRTALLEKRARFHDLLREIDAELESYQQLSGNMNLQPEDRPNSIVRKPRAGSIDPVDPAVADEPDVDPATGTRTDEIKRRPEPDSVADPATQSIRPAPIGDDGEQMPEPPATGEDPTPAVAGTSAGTSTGAARNRARLTQTS